MKADRDEVREAYTKYIVMSLIVCEPICLCTVITCVELTRLVICMYNWLDL